MRVTALPVIGALSLILTASISFAQGRICSEEQARTKFREDLIKARGIPESAQIEVFFYKMIQPGQTFTYWTLAGRSEGHDFRGDKHGAESWTAVVTDRGVVTPYVLLYGDYPFDECYLLSFSAATTTDPNSL